MPAALLALAACDRQTAEDPPAEASEGGESDEGAEEDEAAGGKSDAGSDAGEEVSDGPLQITLPSGFQPVERSTKPLVVKGVEVEMATLSTHSKSRASSVMVTHATFPEEFDQETPPEEVLASSRDGMVGKLGGEVLREEELDRSGHTAREILLKRQVKGIDTYWRIQIHVKAPHLVQVMLISPERSKVSGEMAEAYFESLKIGGESSPQRASP